jgi:hypothetical protein
VATSTWSSGALHDGDANFRVWGKELSDALQAFNSTPGLTMTGDTGQINWATVTRPSSATDAGYEVYYLNDSLHSTSPIYFKLYYGTHGSAANPRLRIEIGTGSNGSGTLTGLGSGTIYVVNISAAGSATAKSSYACVNTGFVGLGWKISAGFEGAFFICRSCDADGTPNSKAAVIVTRSSSTAATVRAFRYESTAAAYTADTTSGAALAVVPQSMTDSTVGANKQVFLCWMAVPDVRPVFGVAAVITTEFAAGATLSVAMVGTTARTYVGLAGVVASIANGNTAYGIAMLYE